MELYLLRPIHKEGDDPWEPWYDKAFGFVIRAKSEEKARELANGHAGDENRGHSIVLGKTIATTKNPWLSSEHSICEILTNDGPEEEIIRDFNAA